MASWNDLRDAVNRSAASQKEFAKNTGIPQSSLAAFLNLNQKLREEHLTRLAEILETSADNIRSLFENARGSKIELLREDGVPYVTESPPASAQAVARHASLLCAGDSEAALTFLTSIARDEAIDDRSKLHTILEFLKNLPDRPG